MSYLPKIIKNVLIFNTFRFQNVRALSFLNTYHSADCKSILSVNQNYPTSVKVNKTFVRFKYAKKDSTNDNQDDDDDSSDFSQFNLKKDPNLAKVTVNSLRTDLILKTALNLARKY